MKTTDKGRRAISKIGEQHLKNMMFLIRSKNIKFIDELVEHFLMSKSNLYFYLSVLEERRYVKLVDCIDKNCSKLASIRNDAKNSVFIISMWS